MLIILYTTNCEIKVANRNKRVYNYSHMSKIEAISGISALLPQISGNISSCEQMRAKLEKMVVELNERNRIEKEKREQAQKQAQAQEKYKDLIAQREKERKDADDKLKERTGQVLATKKEVVAPKPVPNTPVQCAPAQAPRPTAPTQSATQPQTQRIFTPSQSTPTERGPYSTDARPIYPPRDPSRTPYPQGGQNGSRPPYQQQGSRPPYQGQQGARPPYQPNGARPQGTGATRPAGATSPLRAIKPTEKFVPKVDTFSAKKKVKNFDTAERTAGGAMDKRTLMRRGMLEEHDIEERMLTRVFRTKKSREGVEKPREQSNVIILTSNTIQVKTLSEKIGKPVTEIIKQLMVLGSMCTINSTIDFDTAQLVAGEFGFDLQLHADKTFEEKMGLIHMSGADLENKMEVRPPVVTIMGHVDHGKTSLLDAIRKTNVVKGEHGGITQHIGAYMVKHNDRKITFIDTPGHSAFEKMRARGAKITDIAILLVAGDDGVMEQTIESIKQIQKNQLPMIVAVSKMDKKEANVERVKEQLATHNVLTEDWGGDAILVPVSSYTGKGINDLLEMILLLADMKGFRANPHKEAQGAIIDAHSDPKMGAMVTVLVQSGTMHVGDTIMAGTTYGKVKRMTDENGKAVKNATPGMPVQVMGFAEVPKAGDACYVVDEKLTKQVVSERKDKEQVTKTKAGSKNASEIDAIARLDDRAKKQLNVIVKGDVSGSVEAIIQGIKNITSDEVIINVISSGVGVVNDNDITLGEVAHALVIAFNVKTSPTATQMAKKQKVVVHQFNVIYRIFDFVTDQMVRLFTPKFNEVYYGKAEVRKLFKSSTFGQIAGSMVIDGKILRNASVRLKRGKDTVGEYKIESLKIVKDDVKEVDKGFECGIKLADSPELKEGDIIECFGMEQQPIMYNGRKYEFKDIQ